MLNKDFNEELGLPIFFNPPDLKLNELIGMNKLKMYIKEMEKGLELEKKGIFLIGLAGMGKSYSAKTVAGELNRYLVELDLSRIMLDSNPISNLHKAFQLLEKLSLKVILLTKKMVYFSSREKRIWEELLTIFNNLNTPEGYQVDAFLWATTDNLKQVKRIMENDPEFWGKLDKIFKVFFVDFPCYYEAIDIFKLYFRKNKLPFPRDNYFFSDLIGIAEIIGEKKIIQKLRIGEYALEEILVRDFSKLFIYTPEEIVKTVERVKRDIVFFAKKFGKFTETFSQEEIKEFLEYLANYTSDLKDFDKIAEKIGEDYFSYYRKMKDFRREVKIGTQGKWEKMLLAFFFTAFNKTIPILQSKAMLNTLKEFKKMEGIYFSPASRCSYF